MTSVSLPEVPVVDNLCYAADLARVGRAFILAHDFAHRVPWGGPGTPGGPGPCGRTSRGPTRAARAAQLRQCPLAQSACWHALLSPDGVVGAYSRDRFGVDVVAAGCPLKIGEASPLRWRLRGGTEGIEASESEELMSVCSPPRHVATDDLRDLDQALSYWMEDDGRERSQVQEGALASGEDEGDGSGTAAACQEDGRAEEQEPTSGVGVVGATCCTAVASVAATRPVGASALAAATAAPAPSAPPSRFRAYLHGCVGRSETLAALAGTVFDDLQRQTGSLFGSAPFYMSLYASSSGLQTNLHADERSGFLVQVVGSKRVVLIGRKQAAARKLRCGTWGNREAPVHRRSWFSDGVPDKRDWDQHAPFAGAGGREVEVRPGQALYIPKGVFHDVLSRGRETIGIVLRCSD